MEKNYFSQNIRYLRLKSRMSQEQFGKQIGKSKACISYYEAGTRSPVLEDVFSLADFFGLSVNALLTEDLENSKGYIIHSNEIKDISDDDVQLIASIVKALRK